MTALTEDQIPLAYLLTLRSVVKFEAAGMTRRGRSATAISKELLGLKKTVHRGEVIAALSERIEELKAKIQKG